MRTFLPLVAAWAVAAPALAGGVTIISATRIISVETTCFDPEAGTGLTDSGLDGTRGLGPWNHDTAAAVMCADGAALQDTLVSARGGKLTIAGKGVAEALASASCPCFVSNTEAHNTVTLLLRVEVPSLLRLDGTLVAAPDTCDNCSAVLTVTGADGLVAGAAVLAFGDPDQGGAPPEIAVLHEFAVMAPGEYEINIEANAKALTGAICGFAMPSSSYNVVLSILPLGGSPAGRE